MHLAVKRWKLQATILFGRSHCKDINQKGKYPQSPETFPNKLAQKGNKQLSWGVLFSCSWDYLLKYHPLIMSSENSRPWWFCSFATDFILEKPRAAENLTEHFIFLKAPWTPFIETF